MMTWTREEHMEFCKKRAIECVNDNDLDGAFASMVHDLKEHKDTEAHSSIQLGMMLMLSGHLSTQEEMRKFINGFN